MEHQLKQHHKDNVAFVLGNGTSRSKLNLNNLKAQGTIYGCNALYREFEPDYLVAVDVKMVNEIIATGYHNTHQLWTNPNKGVNTKTNVNFFSPHKGWSSGPTSLWFACQNGHKHIYIAGFDYQGLDGKFNNVYADTFNYKRSGDAATFFGNWLNQTERTIREHGNINFYRLFNQGGFVPDKLAALKNLQHITYEKFQEKYKDCIYNNEIDQKTTI
jgi:hypothetical protein